MSPLRLRWSRRCERRSFGRRQLHSTRSQPRCPRRSSRSRSEPGRWTSPTTSPSNVARRMRPGPTPSCIARCSAELARARGWEVHLYDAKAVVGQAGSVLAERADEVLRVLGRRWGRPGRRTIGSRSPRRSWRAESVGAVAEDDREACRRHRGRGQGPARLRAVAGARGPAASCRLAEPEAAPTRHWVPRRAPTRQGHRPRAATAEAWRPGDPGSWDCRPGTRGGG